jgi:protein CpxP
VNKKYLMTALIVALAAGLAVTVFAQGPRWGHGRHEGRMLHWMSSELNLTDAQQAQIKTILQAEHAKIQPLVQQLRKNQQAQDASLNGSFDEAKAQAFAASQAQIMTNVIVERQRAKSQIYAVLTPEQQQKAIELRQQREQRRQQWMHKHQQGQTPPTPQ